MKNTSCFNQLRWCSAALAIAAAFAVAPSAMAQDNAARGVDTTGYSVVDLTAFFGTQWYQFAQNGDIRPLTFAPAITAGFRVSEDLWKYVGLEESFSIGLNKIELLPYGIPNKALLGS